MIEKVLGFICIILGVVLIGIEYGSSLGLNVWCVVFGLYGVLKQ